MESYAALDQDLKWGSSFDIAPWHGNEHVSSVDNGVRVRALTRCCTLSLVWASSANFHHWPKARYVVKDSIRAPITTNDFWRNRGLSATWWRADAELHRWSRRRWRSVGSLKKVVKEQRRSGVMSPSQSAACQPAIRGRHGDGRCRATPGSDSSFNWDKAKGAAQTVAD